jgi:hypothetical protein
MVLQRIVLRNYHQMLLQKMGFMDRFIVKRITKNDKDVLNFKEENISRFALALNNA